MCCFTEEVEKVSDTSIFVRASGAEQLVIYSMAYAATSELAMVLPIPVTPGAGEDALNFVSLEDCPDFFAQLRAGFPMHTEDWAAGSDLLSAVDEESTTLVVHEVGSYEASFVPRPEDFGRLDERFRLPAELWLKLTQYRDWGFAVFKLRRTAFARVHPMAFEFPRRERARLFFPTLHMHHRHVERYADFDHTLYCQPEPALNFHLRQWEDSERPAATYVKCPQAARLLDLSQPCWRAIVEGRRENRDTWIGRGETLPAHVAA